jgi:hypothetical protein
MTLCSFGFHDWEYIEKTWDGFNPLYRRVCLRCGKKQDDITEYEKYIEAQGQIAKARQKKAIELWEKS